MRANLSIRQIKKIYININYMNVSNYLIENLRQLGINETLEHYKDENNEILLNVLNVTIVNEQNKLIEIIKGISLPILVTSPLLFIISNFFIKPKALPISPPKIRQKERGVRIVSSIK